MADEVKMLMGYSKEELIEQLLIAAEIIRHKNKEIKELKNG